MNTDVYRYLNAFIWFSSFINFISTSVGTTTLSVMGHIDMMKKCNAVKSVWWINYEYFLSTITVHKYCLKMVIFIFLPKIVIKLWYGAISIISLSVHWQNSFQIIPFVLVNQFLFYVGTLIFGNRLVLILSDLAPSFF